MYQPSPIDTSHVVLSPALEALVERLAENAHDIWAAKRVAEGWSLGATRDDALRRHPDLVPYEQLPDSEKEYDRATVLGVMKALVALGYEVREVNGTEVAKNPP